MEIVASSYCPADIRTPRTKASSTPRATVTQLFASINKDFKITPARKSPDPMKKVKKFGATQSLTTFATSQFLSTMRDTPRGKKLARLCQKNSMAQILAKINLRMKSVEDISDFGGRKGPRFPKTPRLHECETRPKTPGPGTHEDQVLQQRGQAPVLRFSTSKLERMIGDMKLETPAPGSYYPKQV